MTTSENTVPALMVVLDPVYGRRLRDLPSGKPMWVLMSPDNEPAIRAHWQDQPDVGHLWGVTAIMPQTDASPENELLYNLDTIDLHHGPYSTSTPYEELEVIGVRLSPAIRDALGELGFTKFDETGEGFRAQRTTEQAAIRRD